MTMIYLSFAIDMTKLNDSPIDEFSNCIICIPCFFSSFQAKINKKIIDKECSGIEPLKNNFMFSIHTTWVAIIIETSAVSLVHKIVTRGEFQSNLQALFWFLVLSMTRLSTLVLVLSMTITLVFQVIAFTSSSCLKRRQKSLLTSPTTP